ncbi:MAG: ATP-dependent Clp protease proteolytic subunit [Kiritimatiellaeota bacterium]|nr:ATP-dependent Clp protease proteolytic subunit [Kiritimatiellota bacterium]
MLKLLRGAVVGWGLLGFIPAGAVHAAPPASSSNVVYSIPIRGMIEPALLYVIRRGVAEAEAAQARAIVFVMDTNGGTVDAADEIVHTIQRLKIPSYTLVENRAFSAGAIIALATQHIYMTPGAVIGDAMPILMTPWGSVQEMPADLKEKSVAAVAVLIRAAAEQSGHDPDVAEKMVRIEKDLKIGGEEICPPGRLLALTNIAAERKVGQHGRPLISAGTVKDLNALLDTVGIKNAAVRELKVTAAERLARWIAMLAPLFLMAGLLGIYLEIKTPGVVLPGILGAVCLALFFWGHHIAGLAGLEEVILFVLGAGLLVVEVVLIPGFGLLGFLGLLLMLWALLSAMIGHLPGAPQPFAWPAVQVPLFKLALALVLLLPAAWLAGRWLPRTGFYRRLVLERAAAAGAGYRVLAEDTAALIGLTGTALMPLRPAGAAQFGARRLDVVTRGDFLPAGTVLHIVEAHGNRLVVEKAG